MDWLKQFPRHADVIAADAAETLALPFEERFDQLLRLIASGEALATATGLEADRRFRDGEKAKWQRAHREVFERHGH